MKIQPKNNMIDTIILSIPKSKIVSLNLTSEGAYAWDLHSKTQGYEKFVRNPTSNNKKTGLYFPRLTGIKRFAGTIEVQQTVKIEFSAPKLLHLNNLDELEEKDFEKVVERLMDRMKQMGVIVDKETLKNASVTSVHYSKNITLSEGYTSQYVLAELGKINLSRRFDITRARYMNDGQSITLYTIAHSLILYDKIADLIKPLKRAIDKEQNPFQQSLFAELNKREEVLRFEVRLSKKRKMNSLLKQLGYKENPNFEEIFTLVKSLKVLNHYWQNIIKENPLALFAYSLTVKDLLKQIFIVNTDIKPKQALYLVALMQIAKEGNGLREARSIFTKYSDDRTWYRIMADFRLLSKQLSDLKPRGWLDQIQKQLSHYKPYKTTNDN